MTAEAELLAAIAAALDDDAPRLVYADWLAERGDPRGEFMHLQLARAAMTDSDERARPTDARIAELLDEHRDRWLGRLRQLATHHIQVGFARGMLGSVSAPLAVLAKNATQLLAALPLLTELRTSVDRTAHDLAVLAGTGLLERARTLAVSSTQALRVAGWDASALPNLRALDLSTLAFSPAELAAALAAPQLQSLRCHHCRFNKGAVEAFASLAGPLRVIDLQAAHLGPRLGELLGAQRHLVHAALAGNELGSAGLAALLPALASLVEVDLRRNALVAADLPALLDAIPAVRVLELGGNALGDAGAAVIASHPRAAQLVRLHLGDAGITPRGARVLAAAAGLAQLRSLVLTGKRFDPETEAILLASPHLAGARIYGGDRFLARGPARTR